jgi:hypothetical protein
LLTSIGENTLKIAKRPDYRQMLPMSSEEYKPAQLLRLRRSILADFPSHPHQLTAAALTNKAAMTPGTQPTSVSKKTNKIVPQPRSNTANGGKMIHTNARPKPISTNPFLFYQLHLDHLYAQVGVWLCDLLLPESRRAHRINARRRQAAF